MLPTPYRPGAGSLTPRSAWAALDEKLVRQASQNSRAVAGICFAATGAPMVHVPQDAVRIVDDLAGADSLDVGDKSDAAAVVFERRVVEAVLSWRAKRAERLRRIRVLRVC